MATALAARLPVPTDPPPARGVLDYLGYEGCVRLPLPIDAASIAAEIDRLPAEVWQAADRDPVVQEAVESFFVVGHPRGPHPLPPEDRPVLERLPSLRQLLREAIPATPTRAITARLRPDGIIPIHTDTPRHFRATVRLSIQIAAAGGQRLLCGGRWYDLEVGEVWAIDNLRPHAVLSSGGARTNVLVDCVPSDALAQLLAAGERDLGVVDETASAAMEAHSRAHYRARRWRALRYELWKRWRRRDWRIGA